MYECILWHTTEIRGRGARALGVEEGTLQRRHQAGHAHPEDSLPITERYHQSASSRCKYTVAVFTPLLVLDPLAFSCCLSKCVRAKQTYMST